MALGAATFALTVLYIPLAWPAGDVSDGWNVLLALVAFAVPGVVVARRQPGNPIGWILIGLGLLGAFYTDASRYSVFDYHFHHGALPFGPAAAVVAQALWGTGQFYLLPLIILLFPDGRLTRGWDYTSVRTETDGAFDRLFGKTEEPDKKVVDWRKWRLLAAFRAHKWRSPGSWQSQLSPHRSSARQSSTISKTPLRR